MERGAWARDIPKRTEKADGYQRGTSTRALSCCCGRAPALAKGMSMMCGTTLLPVDMPGVVVPRFCGPTTDQACHLRSSKRTFNPHILLLLAVRVSSRALWHAVDMYK